MLEIRNIRKSFTSQGSANQGVVLNEVNLSIPNGEFFSLLGPSGCGKTTLLRILSGLETASSGEIFLDGQRVDHLSPQARPFNMVFQKYALFPHLSVVENVAFGLKMRKVPAAELASRCERVLDMVGLKSLAHRRPETLSGGQAQRVAVARALVNEPRVLLLDEPLSALDQKMREHMQSELRTLQKRLGLTFIYVTHDQEEALTLSDRIGIMNEGRLEQVSTPRDLYEKPRTIFAAQFVGRMSHLRGHLVSVDGEWAVVRLADQTLIRGRHGQGVGSLQVGEAFDALVRPEKIRVGREKSFASESAGNVLAGVLGHRVFKGDQTEVHVDLGSCGPVHALISGSAAGLPDDGKIHLSFLPEDTFLFQGRR